MSQVTRLLLGGLIILHVSSASEAQHHSMGGPFGGHGSHFSHPGGSFHSGSANPSAASPALNAVVGSYAAVSGSQVSGGFGVGFSGGYLGFNSTQLFFPMGQEGPGGLMLPHFPETQTMTPSASTTRNKVNRAEELIEVGDRSFRGGNYKRAADRYQLAIKANIESPSPHVRLAQIAVVRGDYNKAAGHLRDAVASGKGGGWLVDAPDIQSIFGEPKDFSMRIAQLETHLQAHPTNRNAWFVLGAENYFSGRPQPASDIFTRLSDRNPDEALSAFLDASTVAMRSTSRE